MGQETKEVIKIIKNLVLTCGIVGAAYVIGYCLSFIVYPAQEIERTMMLGIFVIVGMAVAIALTLIRLFKRLT